jgi:hypothetical protein
MINRLRNGESPNPLRGYQESHLMSPPYRVPEVLIRTVEKWAKAYECPSGQFVTGIVMEGLDKMTPSPTNIHSGEGRVQLPFKIPEALIEDIRAKARRYDVIPGDLFEEVLEVGLRGKMFPSDAVVIVGPNGPISVQRLETRLPVSDNEKHQEA